MSLLHSPDFWVAVAFILFVAIVWRAGAFGAIASALDDRTARIRRELDDARKLREEAEALVAEYRQRRSEAENEAAAIVSAARTEAEDLTAEAEKRMQEFVARRTKLAETKIAQAETQALADVRAAAADTAVRAAEQVLNETVKDKTADGLIANAIKDVKARLS
jgi:F-type H+-transporting ATPase subunit b